MKTGALGALRIQTRRRHYLLNFRLAELFSGITILLRVA